MPNQLFIVVGIPGTRIQRALKKFKAFTAENHERVEVVSLEEELQKGAAPTVQTAFPFIKHPGVLETFLLPRETLRELWLETFDKVWDQTNSALNKSHVILTLHLSYFHHGTNEYLLPADLRLLCDRFANASMLVTLIDDIYDCDQSLFAHGTGAFNQPRSVEDAIFQLHQILEWRSVEVMLADSLANAAEVKHRIFAVKHPIDTFYDLLFSTKPLLYFSHPISEPRRALSGVPSKLSQDDARAFVSQMEHAKTALRTKYTVIEPTAVDELRFGGTPERAGNLEARWPFRPDHRKLLWVQPEVPDATTASFAYPAGWDEDQRAPIPGSDLVQRISSTAEDTPGTVKRQINARDHALVEQVDRIACYRPLFQGNASRGVREELLHLARLVRLGKREAVQASVVFAPEEDDKDFPRERLVNELAAWRRREAIEGTDEAFAHLYSQVRSGDLDHLFEGDWERLQEALAEFGVTVVPLEGEESELATGGLGASSAVRRNLRAQGLAPTVAGFAARGSYLDPLRTASLIHLVESEQMFYSALGVGKGV